VHLNTSLNPQAFWRDAAYLLIARLAGRKTVYQVHGGVLTSEFLGQGVLPARFTRWILALPDVVVLLGQPQMRAYLQLVPGARIRVIPNAIEIDDLNIEASKSAPGVPLHLVYLGRFAREKGIFEIIEAVRILATRGIIVRLSMGGGGPDEGTLHNAVSRAGIKDLVIFRGALYGKEKNRLWREADLFVFPTYHLEGLPYSLLESMAAGAVPITCPVAAIPDVIEEGVHGLFVPPRNPLALAAEVEQLHHDRAQLARLSHACRQRILEYYTLPRMAHDFQKLYASL